MARKFILGHSRRRTPYDFLEEDRGFETACWIWQRATNNKGYGLVKEPGGGTVTAHRHYYARRHGDPGPGVQLHHRCEVKNCVNPDHIEVLTTAQHRQQHASKLDWDKVRVIRESSLSARKLGEMFGVSHRLVLDVRNGKNWKE